MVSDRCVSTFGKCEPAGITDDKSLETVEKSPFCSISVQNTIAREHSVINLYTNSNFTGAKLTISEYLKYSRTVFPRCIEHNHAIVDFAPVKHI